LGYNLYYNCNMLIKNQQHIADNNMNDNFDLYQ
jgi:hypothetical protein